MKNNTRHAPEEYSALRRNTAPDIWAIAAYFNPERYRTKRYNLELFRNHLERQGVQYMIVECAFEGSEFQLPADRRVLRIRARDVMWQKERLLNCALETVPPSIDKIAWLDSDILFENDNWHRKTSDALNHFSVVQPYDWSVRLPAGCVTYKGEGRVSRSFASIAVSLPRHLRTHYSDHGRTGFAWAARRYCIEPDGLYDACIMGGADHLMAHAFDMDLDCPCLQMFWSGNAAFRRQFESWARRVQARFGNACLGVVPGRVLHLWHGGLSDRAYGTRQRILKSETFDPVTDLCISPSGAWEWASDKPRLHAVAATYFTNRREDGHSSAKNIKKAAIPSSRQVDDFLEQSSSSAIACRSAKATPGGASVIYEWHAWNGHMLQKLMPYAQRLRANPLISSRHVLALLPEDTAVFAFHLNLTHTAAFPLDRSELIASLRKKGIILLNSEITDISKSTLHAVCRELGLRSLDTQQKIGSPGDLVILKTDRNYGGFGERQLSAEMQDAMRVVLQCPLENINDYRIVRREDVPNDWWNDASLVVERFVYNTDGRKYRAYFAGNRVVFFVIFDSHLIMRFHTSKRRQPICTSLEILRQGMQEGLSSALQDAMFRLTDRLRADFGAIDFVEDDVGAIYPIDLNVTSFSRALSDDLLDYLRVGLDERVAVLREFRP